jgi:hypothetical protein
MSKTLVCTKSFLPYQVGDVFTVTDKEWEAMAGESVQPGRDLSLNPLLRTCVEEYKPGKEEHVALLEKQRGKSVDADTEVSATGNADARLQEVEAQLAQAQADRDAAVQAADKAKADAEAQAQAANAKKQA